MIMVSEPIVWIVLTLAVALVVVVAMWLGRGLTIRKDKNGLAIQTEKGGGTIKVGKKFKGKNVEELRITGEKIGYPGQSPGPVLKTGNSLEVANEAEITNSKKVEITGRQIGEKTGEH